MPNPYSCSIFAYELSRIIAPHQLVELSRTPVSLESKKVQVLVESLKSVKRLPGLNQGEITTIVLKLNLDDDQRLQIYAALIALGVQRLLLEYLSLEAMLMQAKLCFERAKSMLELLPKSVRNTEGWKYWYGEVEKELEVVEDEME